MIESIISKPELFWFIVGLGLFLAELLIPGFFIFFFGLGAWVTAIVCLIGEPGTNIQIMIFALSSVASLIGLRRIIKKKFFYNKSSDQVDVDDEFTGKEALAISDFGGLQTGKVEFKGTIWQAESKTEIAKGQRVLITSKENFKLIVEPKK
jgi:membrane protein implicated in regulation of membrane protease activity